MSQQVLEAAPVNLLLPPPEFLKALDEEDQKIVTSLAHLALMQGGTKEIYEALDGHTFWPQRTQQELTALEQNDTDPLRRSALTVAKMACRSGIIPRLLQVQDANIEPQLKHALPLYDKARQAWTSTPSDSHLFTAMGIAKLTALAKLTATSMRR